LKRRDKDGSWARAENEICRLQRAYREMFEVYPFQVFAHLTFAKRPHNNEEISRATLRFIRKTISKTSLSIAALGVVARGKVDARPHVHLAVYGRNSKSGKTLADIPAGAIEQAWRHGNSMVSPIYDMAGVGNYLTKNLAPGTGFEGEVISYGTKTLKAIKTE